MKLRDLKYKYERGKQIITLSVIIIAILGFFLDAVTYQSIYSTLQFCLQITSVIALSSALIVFLIDPKRNYPIAFGIAAYVVVVNILLTAIVIHTFIVFKNFTEANILSRDTIFIFILIALTGFMLGRRHIFIKGVLLIGLLLYFIFVKKEIFFIQNAAVYIVISVGFLFVFHFLVSILNYLIKGLEESNILMEDKNRELETLKDEIEQRRSLLEGYQQSLINLAKKESVFKSGQDQLFREICTTAANTLRVNRASIWLFEDENNCIVQKFLFDHDNSTDETTVLKKNDFPIYFQAIETKPFIMATDARTHNDTKEFTRGYLQSRNTFSILDCPIIIDRTTVGIISCENRNEIKTWNIEDALFIQSLADFIALSYKNVRIQNLLAEIRNKNFELVEKNNEIETMNEELSSLNEELATTNDSLEETVKIRTQDLEKQNVMLTEYAFINSHLLRAPLSRILGLSDLIGREVQLVSDARLIDSLIVASKELDAIVRKISDVLYDGNNLTREDVNAIVEKNLISKAS